MAPFRGTFDHTLDAKNRLTVPARFRDEFDSGAVLAKHWDQRPCVSLWRPAEYDAVTTGALNRFPPLSRDRSEMERYLFGRSQDTELDRAGRVMVPGFLVTHASLVKDVLIVGAGNRLELWSPERWESDQETLNQNVAEVIGRVDSAG